MKKTKGMNARIVLCVLAWTLVACGQPSDPYAKTESPTPDQFVEPANPALQQELSGEGQGTIVSIGPDGDFLSIDHGPIEGVGMGAMTMGFDTLSSVDLSQLSKGAIIAFRVKKGRDGSFRVTEVCEVQTSGDDCLTESVGE